MSDEWKQLDDSDVVDLMREIIISNATLAEIDELYPDADSLLCSGRADEATELHSWLLYAEHLFKQCLIHTSDRRDIHGW